LLGCCGAVANGTNREPIAQLLHVLLHLCDDAGITSGVEDAGDQAGDRDHLRFAQPSGGHGRRADADPRGHHRLLGVKGDRVFVDGDVCRLQKVLAILAGDPFREDIGHEEMVVRAAADDAEAGIGHRLRHRTGVADDLGLVLLELRLQRFVKGNGLGGNDVHERSALNAGKE
jgi:hypothetical protein